MKSSKTITTEEFVRFGALRRILLKFRNRSLYYDLKHTAKKLEFVEGFAGYCPPPLQKPLAVTGRPPTFKHSGNAGDVVYALPSLRELAGAEGGILHLAIDVPLRDRKLNHPLGGVQLNRRMFEMLQPLLARQDYLKAVQVHDGAEVDYDLDVFRDAPLRMDRLGICRWYFYLFGVTADLSKPWLSAEPDRSFADRVVIARSKRYRNLTLDYRFLRSAGPVVFVGLEEEFEDFRTQVPSAEWVQVPDFLQLARMIAGSRLFIGNQSFPYSLAEGLKVRRVLELDPGMPNVVPAGEQGYDVLYQCQFEHVVRKLLT